MSIKKIGFRKKILLVLLLLITTLLIIYSAFAFFFINEIKTENKILYNEFSDYLAKALEKDNLERHEMFLKTIAEYGASIIEDPKDDVLSSQIELGKFLSEFYREKLLTDKGKSELIDKYFIPRQKAEKYREINKHVYWGVDKIEGKSSDALLFTLDSLKILKDSNNTLIKSVFLKTINKLCIAYPVKSIFSSKSDFKKLEELEPFSLKPVNQKGQVFINENGNIVLWSRFGNTLSPKFDFIIAAVLDYRILMDKICSYAWKRNIDAALLIDKQGNVVFYNHKKDITELDNFISLGTCLYKSGNNKVAKNDEHVKRLRDNMNGFFRFTANGKTFYAGFSSLKDLDWKLLFIASSDDIMSIIDKVEIQINKKNSLDFSMLEKHVLKIQAVLFVLLVMVFIIFIILSLTFSLRLTKSLTVLNEGVKKITGGDLSYKIPELKSGDEIEKLAEAFNGMVDSINKYIKDLTKAIKAKQEIESDIKIAADIQRSMLPINFEIPESVNKIKINTAGILIPSKTISGDFYDYFLVDDENMFFVIGDVSGKGVPASLFMVTIKTILKEYLLFNKKKPLKDILAQLNTAIARDNYSCMFATLFCGLLNLKNGVIHFSAAGHPMPILFRAENNKIEDIPKTKSHLLGAFKAGAKFQSGEIYLNKDDFLFLFTDGITEAQGDNKIMWGRSNLEKTILYNKEKNPELMIESIKNEVVNFTEKSASETDDFTILILRRYY